MIVLENVSKVYQETVPALKGISLHILQGECCFITGPTGAGKSTLLKLIYGLERPSEGRIFLQQRELTALEAASVQALRRHMGFVFQDLRLIEDWTVFDNLGVVLELLGKPASYVRSRVWRVLRWVGLQHRIYARARTLSGGEKQRLALGRAIIHDPDIILADEPVANLDEQTGRYIMNLLFRLHQRGTTVVIVCHAAEALLEYGRVLRLQHGHITEGPPHA